MSQATAEPSPRDGPLEPIDRLFRDLRSGPGGLSSREAGRRLAAHGSNERTEHRGARWPAQVAARLVRGH